jgi:phenylacetate-coenzyme A ligase PaaK-like adenylate-forming protein
MVARHAAPGIARIAADVIAGSHAGKAQIAQRQAERLVELLQAADGTAFYHRVLGGRAPQRVALTDLPATNKTELMTHFEQRVGDPRLTLPGLRALCDDPARIAERYLGDYCVWQSSGSTGEPAVFVQDGTAMTVYDMLEAVRRYSPRPWERLLDPFYFGERLAFVGAIGGHFASHVSMRRVCALNPWLAHCWRCFSILQPSSDLTAQLEAFQPTIIASYPTAAALLAEEAEAGRLRIRPREVWTGGETLSPATRKLIEHGLDCTVCNSYGSSEFLPIAWECGHRRLHVNADWVILEPVDDRHRPVPPGTLSFTTLLTNLANHVQPLIRFDIGDQIVLDAESCPCGSALPVVQVQGRRDDVLVVPGRGGRHVKLLPLALTTVLEDEAGVFDFQLQQLGPTSWRLLLGPKAPQSPSQRAHCRRLLTDFALAQGARELHVATRGVDALPLAHSGKLKRIVAAR